MLCHAISDSVIQTHEAALLLLMFLLYFLVVIFASKVRRCCDRRVFGQEAATNPNFVTQATADLMAAEQAGEGNTVDGREIVPSLDGMIGTDNNNTVEVSACRRWFRQTCQCQSAYSIGMYPLAFLFRLTCPDCAHGSPKEHLYLVTFFASFSWIALFSMVISSVVIRWGTLLDIPAAFLGMMVIAIGAEIPDTIQSVTVARRGYGSMAVSNSTGSQIINICVGLGLPWFISGLAGRPISLPGQRHIQVMAIFQAFNVTTYTTIVLLATIPTWRCGDKSKAKLGTMKGIILLFTYIATVGSYAAYTFGYTKNGSSQSGSIASIVI